MEFRRQNIKEKRMKIRKWLAAATAGAMALAMAGCYDIDEDFFATAEAGNTTAEYTAEAGNSTAEYTAEAPGAF